MHQGRASFVSKISYWSVIDCQSLGRHELSSLLAFSWLSVPSLYYFHWFRLFCCPTHRQPRQELHTIRTRRISL